MKPIMSRPAIQRGLDLIRRLSEWLGDARVRRWAMVLSAVLFVAGLAISIRARPDLVDGIHWPYLLLGVLAVQVSTFIGAQGFLLTAWLVRSPIRLRQAMEVTVLGSAANLLPLPGAVMVRIAALKSAGTRLRLGTGVTLISGTLLSGAAALTAGAVLIRQDPGPAGLIVLIIGAVTAIAGFLACLRVSGRPLVSLAMVGHKFVRLGFSALQLWLAFAALGEVATVAQCLMLSVANVIASAVAVAPGGLGVREVAAATLAPLVGMSPANAFVAASLNRLVVFAGAVPLSLWFARRPRVSQSLS